MKLSEYKEYIEAIPDAAKGDYASARRKLEKLILMTSKAAQNISASR